jgi:putative transcriptional regulator
MREDLFAELLESVRDAGAYLRGEHVEGIRVTFVGEPDPREVRAKLGMSHDEFAAALCITVDDLRRWEQGHWDPRSAAARLLWIAEHHPDAFLGSTRRA